MEHTPPMKRISNAVSALMSAARGEKSWKMKISINRGSRVRVGRLREFWKNNIIELSRPARGVVVDDYVNTSLEML